METYPWQVEFLLPRIQKFVGFVETMAEVAEVGDEAVVSSSTDDHLRRDDVENFPNISAMMDNMPCEEDNYLRVPKVGEEEGWL